MVFLIGIISAGDWDNVKDYDEETKTITITNALGFGADIATVKLDSPLVMYVVPGKDRLVAEFTIDNLDDDYLDVFKKMEFYNKIEDTINVDFTYKVKSISYVPVDIYETQCSKREIGNGSIEDYNCKRTLVKTIQKEEISWVPLGSQNLIKGEIKTIGIFTDVKMGDYVEWIPTLYGVRIDEWAVWASSFDIENIAYYRFIDNGDDATTNAHDWVNFGQTHVPGIFSNGTNSSATTFRNQTATDFNFGNNNFSINFWANVTVSGNFQLFGTRTDNAAGWTILPLDDRWTYTTDGNHQTPIGSFILHEWQMVTVIGNDTKIIIYVNGSLSATFGRGALEDSTIDFKIGKVVAVSNGFTGTIDELSIWNRSLTSTEVSDLWNGGEGIQKTLFDITLNFPVNNFNNISNNLTFNCSTSGASGVLNLSLIVDDVLNVTIVNTTTTNNLSLQSQVTNLASGGHNWSCRAVNDAIITVNSDTRIFNISNFVENSQTFNTITTSGARENFTINITYDTIKFSNIRASLFYNGTGVEGVKLGTGNTLEFNKVITIPGVTVNTNITFYWQIGLFNGTWNDFNSSFNNQSVQIVNIDDCSTFNTLIYNFTILDEETQLVLPNSTVEIQLNLFDLTRTISIVNFSQKFNNTNPVQICFNGSILTNVNYSVDSVIRYFANDTFNNRSYVQESHNILNGLLSNSSIPNNIKLFDLNADDSTEFQLTFRDSSFSLAPNILVNLFRQYVADNDFKVVEIPLTDSNGQTVLHMVRNDVVYNLVMVDQNGNIVGVFNKIVAFCQDFTIGSCTIRLDAPTGENQIYSYTDDLGISYTDPVYDSGTGLVSFSFVSNDLTSRTVSVEITRNNAFGNRSVCTNSITAPSGTLSCDVSEVSDTDRFLFIDIFVDDALKAQSTIDLEGDDFNFGTVNGAFYAFLLILAIITMFMEDRQTLVIALLIGWAVVLGLGLINGVLIGAFSGGIWLIVCGIILIWKLNQEEKG